MQCLFMIFALIACSAVARAFDPSSNQNVALYWGQNSLGTKTDHKFNEKNLTYYCQSENVDIVLLSFLSNFPGKNNIPTLTFNGYEFSEQYQNELTGLANQIKTCQNNDKLVLLSLGGEGSGYGFKNDSEGSAFAHTLWNMFGPANESTSSNVKRPFGDVLIDGFDLDAENTNETGYINLLYALKQHINATQTKQYYLSLAPQCPTADNNLAQVLESNYLDFAFIQFYNNKEACDANTDKFNWEWWADWAENSSNNKNVKIFLGLPGSSAAAASGYIDNLTLLGEKVYQASRNSSFGGVSIFDAGTAFNNTESPNGDYVEIVKKAFNYHPSHSENYFSFSASSSASSSASNTASGSASSTKNAAAIAGYEFSFFSAALFALFSFI